MHPRFSDVDPERRVILTYDFTKALPPGVALIGIATIDVHTEFGVDPAPANIIVSSDVASPFVHVAVASLVDQVDYAIKVEVATTNASFSVAFTQVLPVRS